MYKNINRNGDAGTGFWTALVASPAGLGFFLIRSFITCFITWIVIIFDLIVSAIGAVINFVTAMTSFTIPLIAIATVIILALYLFWPEIINAIQVVFIPFFQILYDLGRILWNVFGLFVANIIIQIWNALAPTIIFLLEFVINTVVFIITTLVELLGELDLPSIFEDFMEILTPLIELATTILKVLIDVGTAILKALLPIIKGILKIIFVFIRIILKIVSFQIKVLFLILKPFINILIAVARAFSALFGGGSSAAASAAAHMMKRQARKLMDAFTGAPTQEQHGPPTLDEARGSLSAGDFMAMATYEYATQQLKVQDYDMAVDALDVITTGLAQRDAILSSGGRSLNPDHIVPDYDHVLYSNTELLFDEMVDQENDHPSLHLSDQDDSRVHYLKRQLKQARNAYEQVRGGDEDDDDDEVIDLEFASEEETGASKRHPDTVPRVPFASMAEFTEWSKGERTKDRKKHAKVPINITEHKLHMHTTIDPSGEDHWLLDESAKHHPHTIYPGMKTKTYKPIDLIGELHPEKRGVALHEKRRRATAYQHAVKSWYRHMYKRHIRSGRVHQVFGNSFQHLTGHDNLHSLIKTYKEKWASPAHMIHDLAPNWNDNWVTKKWKESDPEHKTRPFFHDYVEDLGFEGGKLPREIWEQHETMLQHEEDHGTLPEQEEKLMGKFDVVPGAVRHIGGHKRQTLADPTEISLAFLYKGRDCVRSVPRFILCIPQIPKNWKIPEANLKELFMIERLANESNCDPPWRPVHCFPCWSEILSLDVAWNALTEARFLIYWLDLPFIIFDALFGDLLGFRFLPSELLGMLGQSFPPLGFFINLWLIYPVGETPPFTAYACFIRYFWSAWLFAVVFFFYYYLLAWLVAWAQRSFYLKLAWWTSTRMRWATYRSLLEEADERLLRQMKANYYAQVSRTQSTIKVPDPAISGNTAALVEAGLMEPRVKRPQVTAANQADLVELTEMERELEQLRNTLVGNLNRLASLLGIDEFNPHVHTPEQESESHQRWHESTALFHVPYYMTPSYFLHLGDYQSTVRQTQAPPNAVQFSQLIPEDNEVPVQVFEELDEPRGRL